MPRQRIDQLDLPRRRFRPNLAPPAEGKKPFESEADAEAWDRKRAAGLRKAGLKRKRQIAAAALAQRLEANDPPNSMASSRYMREQRIRICGSVWQLIVEG